MRMKPKVPSLIFGNKFWGDEDDEDNNDDKADHVALCICLYTV